MARGNVRPEVYWEYRCATVQIEFIFERLKVAWGVGGSYSALAHLDIARLIQEGGKREM